MLIEILKNILIEIEYVIRGLKEKLDERKYMLLEILKYNLIREKIRK